MRSIDRAKYDIGQKVYVYDNNSIIECSIRRISIDQYGVIYGTDHEKAVLGMFSDEARVEYVDYPQEQVFAKKSEAIAHAIEFKNMLLKDTIRNLGINELKKELAKAKKEEERQ